DLHKFAVRVLHILVQDININDITSDFNFLQTVVAFGHRQNGLARDVGRNDDQAFQGRVGIHQMNLWSASRQKETGRSRTTLTVNSQQDHQINDVHVLRHVLGLHVLFERWRNG
ncbi:hypothetical protein DXG03_005939, partial [Asterophora parasitica]